MDAGVLIQPAKLGWRGGQPFSEDFGDIYHASDQAQETERVFLRPTNLAEKAAAAARKGHSLRVGELGFGTGLNFAATAALALKANCRLHFISFDAHPLRPADFVALAAGRQAQLPIYGELSACYPPLLAGWHRRALSGGRILLSVFWGDAQHGLADIAGRQQQPVDAWFLDGFAPDRNPEMWRPALLRRLPTLSGEGAAVATFTAAGRVRRSLQACGFAMRLVDQRPHKRESLAGVLQGSGLARRTLPKRISVVGAGIAGAAAAHHLAARGLTVDLYDCAAEVAAGASGLPLSLLHPRLMADGSAVADWRAHAYAYSRAFLQGQAGFARTSVLQTLGPNLAAARMAQVAAAYGDSGLVRFVDAAEAMRLTGWSGVDDGLLFPGAGVIQGRVLVQALVRHPRISLRLGQPAPAAARPMVLACGAAVRQFPAAAFVEIVEVHGQLDLFALDAPPRLPVVGDGYLAALPRPLAPAAGAPAAGTRVAVGATYEQRPWPVSRATAHNRRRLGQRPHRWLARARGTRTLASDRVAIIGQLAPGLYVSTAHGSMGMTSAPFAGAHVASLVSGDFPPMRAEVEAVTAPSRFHSRQVRRGYRLGARPPA